MTPALPSHGFAVTLDESKAAFAAIADVAERAHLAGLMRKWEEGAPRSPIGKRAISDRLIEAQPIELPRLQDASAAHDAIKPGCRYRCCRLAFARLRDPTRRVVDR